MSRVGAYVMGLIVLLAVVAALSRVLTMKGSPAYVKNAFDALSNLFKGAFAQ